jgi:acetoin utilization deacetylase AcuC-like enzyme
MPVNKVIVWTDKCVPQHIDTYSPSWRKPKEFMAAMEGSIKENNIPVIGAGSAYHDLHLVHDMVYVDDVLTGREPNGFGTRGLNAAKSCLYTTGAFAEGVRLARGGVSSCVPVSGFHHAGYAFNGGFCTFNGLALGAAIAVEIGMKPGILDLDMHYGNGTADILRNTSMEIPHFTYGGTDFCSKRQGKRFLRYLPTILDAYFRDCDVLLFQAGADPHIDDPLGGCLTTEQMRERDAIVFQHCHDKGIPVVWDLAGGYQKPLDKVLEIHKNTFTEWVAR